MNKPRGAPGGRSVLPLSISTLGLRGSNKAETIKSNSVIQNTPQNFTSGERTELKSALQEPTPMPNRASEAGRRALDGGQGPGFTLTDFEIQL